MRDRQDGGRRGAHIGEARAELIIVDADERIAIEQVDVVVDHHDIAASEIRIQAASGIRNDEKFDAECFHQANWERCSFGGISLVAMESALHGDDGNAAELAAEEAAFVADCGGLQEVWDFAVVDCSVERDRFADRS